MSTMYVFFIPNRYYLQTILVWYINPFLANGPWKHQKTIDWPGIIGPKWVHTVLLCDYIKTCELKNSYNFSFTKLLRQGNKGKVQKNENIGIAIFWIYYKAW